MKLQIERIRRVESYDIDLHNNLKISSLFNYMQDAASFHAEELGVGYHTLQEHNIFWVLSWVKVEIVNLPSYGETVNIKTWAKGKNRLFYMRDFIFYDENGNEIIRATTAWLLLNSETKRISDLNKIGLVLPYFPEENAIDEYPGKFNFETKEEHFFLRKIYYSDIDINQHVNNARYIEIILDCYNKKEHNDKKIHSLTISYKGETHFMDELEIKKSSIVGRDSSDLIKAVRKEDYKEVFNQDV